MTAQKFEIPIVDDNAFEVDNTKPHIYEIHISGAYIAARWKYIGTLYKDTDDPALDRLTGEEKDYNAIEVFYYQAFNSVSLSRNADEHQWDLTVRFNNGHIVVHHPDKELLSGPYNAILKWHQNITGSSFEPIIA